MVLASQKNVFIPFDLVMSILSFYSREIMLNVFFNLCVKNYYNTTENRKNVETDYIQ